jgi:hypothetical protein
MLNGILLVQNPLARLAIAHSALPDTHSSFEPLEISQGSTGEEEAKGTY